MIGSSVFFEVQYQFGNAAPDHDYLLKLAGDTIFDVACFRLKSVGTIAHTNMRNDKTDEGGEVLSPPEPLGRSRLGCTPLSDRCALCGNAPTVVQIPARDRSVLACRYTLNRPSFTGDL